MACALSPVLLYCVHVFPRLAVIYYFELRPQTLCCFILPDITTTFGFDVTLIVSKVRRVVIRDAGIRKPAPPGRCRGESALHFCQRHCHAAGKHNTLSIIHKEMGCVISEMLIFGQALRWVVGWVG